MDCLHVRELLPEHALSALSAEERAFVDRHLEWCAGCRKEAAELAAGAAAAGRAIRQATPPPDLEDRVVRAVRAAAGGGRPRRRPRLLAGVAAAAVAVGMLGFSWGAWSSARVQDEREKRSAAEDQARQLTQRIQELIQTLLKQESGPDRSTEAIGEARQATLAPPAGSTGGGGAVVYTSPRDTDWALVVVGGLPKTGLPYRVTLRSTARTLLVVGTIRELDSGGGADVWTRFPQNLRPFRTVVVTDRTGRPVLRGSLPEAAAPVPSPS